MHLAFFPRFLRLSWQEEPASRAVGYARTQRASSPNFHISPFKEREKLSELYGEEAYEDTTLMTWAAMLQVRVSLNYPK